MKIKSQFITRLILFLILISGVALLFTASSVLTISLLPGFPLGNLLGWILIVDYSLLYYPLQRTSNRRNKLNFFYRLSTIMALLWGVVSYLLAGNWAFTFASKVNAKIWIIYSGIILSIPILTLMVKRFLMYLSKE